jgi:energy-converting hydrogenase Eha subunit C
MPPYRNVQRIYLIAAIAFELLLALASTVYLSVTSPSFLLVIIALLLSIAGIVVRIRKADRQNAQTLYE